MLSAGLGVVLEGGPQSCEGRSQSYDTVAVLLSPLLEGDGLRAATLKGQLKFFSQSSEGGELHLEVLRGKGRIHIWEGSRTMLH